MPSYTESDVRAAIEDMRKGVSMRQAAKKWSIPRITLRDRLAGHLPRSIAFSGLQRLSVTQESLLADWVLLQADLGVPITHQQLRALGQRVAYARGGDSALGKRWATAFLKRNPKCQAMRGRKIDSARVNGATVEIITSWFPRLRIDAVRYIRPSNRWNMDEAGIMEGQGTNGLVLGKAARQAILKKQPGLRVWTTLIEYISPTGVSLPPLVIFKGKSIQQ
jgi:hypothetical protein